MKRRSSSPGSRKAVLARVRLDCSSGRSIGRGQRRGAAIIFAMVALLLASMMIGALLQMTAASHRQMIREQFRVQAGLLADAGFRLALVHRQAQPEWNGEIWNISGDDLPAGFAAEVQMTLEDEPGSATKTLKVTAEYPVNNPSVVRVIRRRRML